MKNKIENQGIYETLVAQLDRVARHNRQGSIGAVDKAHLAPEI